MVWPIGRWYWYLVWVANSYPYATLKIPMRQLVLLILSLGVVAVYAQNPPDSTESPASKRIELAKQELQKITELVQAGALPRVRLEQAELDVADAQDEAILEHTLYGAVPLKDLNDQLIDDMVAAAQRRVERQQVRLAQAQKLVTDGVTPSSTLTPFQEELAMRRVNLNLAHNRAQLIGELMVMAKFEKSAAEIQAATTLEYRDTYTKGMEHYEGNGTFLEKRDLKPLALAFEKKFERPLPVSADGDTAFHRSMGFDHRGRIDVAVNPGEPEGVWLRRYLKARQIPYYAFTRAMRGKASAAHIHIGPGSIKLHNNAD